MLRECDQVFDSWAFLTLRVTIAYDHQEALTGWVQSCLTSRKVDLRSFYHSGTEGIFGSTGLVLLRSKYLASGQCMSEERDSFNGNFFCSYERQTCVNNLLRNARISFFHLPFSLNDLFMIYNQNRQLLASSMFYLYFHRKLLFVLDHYSVFWLSKSFIRVSKLKDYTFWTLILFA